MQKINESFVERLKARSGTASPFPGRWPTRIWVRWLDTTCTPFKGNVYIGKPSEAMLKKLRLGACEFKEFDRKSLVIVQGASAAYVNPRLAVLYHPGAPAIISTPNGRLLWYNSFGASAKAGKFVFYYQPGQEPSFLTQKVRDLLEDVPDKRPAQRLAQAKPLRKHIFDQGF